MHGIVKKFVTSILAVLYLVVSSGTVLHTHYCMDELVKVELMQSQADHCGNCGMEKKVSEKSGCCKDQNKLIKLDKDQKSNDASVQLSKLLAQAISVSYFDNYFISFSSLTEENPASNSPPLYSGTAIYKRNCVFRI